MRTYSRLFHLPHHGQSKLPAFYLASVLRTFVLSFLGIFLPAILFEHHLGLGQQAALFITVSYFLLLNLIQIFLIVPVSRITASMGLRFSLIIGLCCLIGFLSLIQYGLYGWGFFVLSFAAMFWWYAYHLYFAEFGHRSSYGHELGILEAVSIMSGALAPMIGGSMLVYYGQNSLFSLGIVIAFVAMVSVVSLKEPAHVRAISWRSIFSMFRRKSDDFVAFVGAGAEEAISGIIWPVLLFVSFRDFLKVGSYFSFVMIIVVIANYIVGKIADKTKQDKLEEIGAFAVFSSWVGRALVQNTFLLGMFEVIYKLFLSLFRLPLLIIAYNHAYYEKEEYIAFRELAYKIGAILGYFSFMLIIIVGLPFWAILILSALFSLLPLKMKQ